MVSDCRASLAMTVLKEGKGYNMKKMIAFCGLSCTGCDAFHTNQKNDNEERKKLPRSGLGYMDMETKLSRKTLIVMDVYRKVDGSGVTAEFVK